MVYNGATMRPLRLLNFIKLLLPIHSPTKTEQKKKEFYQHAKCTYHHHHVCLTIGRRSTGPECESILPSK